MEVNNSPKEFEGRLSPGKDWREIVAWVGDLPPMPTVAGRAISLIEDPDCTASELTKILSTDAALAARVLKIANSAMFARQREITTLNQAIMVIGFKSLKGVIVAATLRQFQKQFGPNEKMIWEGAMSCGMAASMLAKTLRKKYAEEVFLLGLLHNLGQIVLLFQPQTANEYKKVFKSIQETGGDFITVEQEIFGFAHPLIGALVAKKWNFSSDTCQVILHYGDPLDQIRVDNEVEEKTIIVRLADLITHAAEIGTPPGYSFAAEEMAVLAEKLGIAKDSINSTLETIIAETKSTFEKEKGIYD